MKLNDGNPLESQLQKEIWETKWAKFDLPNRPRNLEINKNPISIFIQFTSYNISDFQNQGSIIPSIPLNYIEFNTF